MKRRLVIFAVVFVLLASATMPQAATPRTVALRPDLSFAGNVATCELRVLGCSSTDQIDAVMKLWYGTTCMKAWTGSDTGYLSMSGTSNVLSNKTYTLTVEVTINGTVTLRDTIERTS